MRKEQEYFMHLCIYVFICLFNIYIHEDFKNIILYEKNEVES